MRRVVVTGLGLVTPLGGNVETSWRNILASKSGAGASHILMRLTKNAPLPVKSNPKTMNMALMRISALIPKFSGRLTPLSFLALMPPDRHWKMPD